MKFSYDPRHNIAYLKFHEKLDQVGTIKISDDLNIDLSSDGTIFGIELLNANEQLKDKDANELKVINEATGKEIDVPITL